MPTVLVVDDESMVCELASRMLRGAGYDVVQAADGRVAWALMLEPTTAVDLVLSDVVMPGLTGTELVALALEHRPQLPIVLMSGYSPTTCRRAASTEPRFRSWSSRSRRPTSSRSSRGRFAGTRSGTRCPPPDPVCSCVV